MFQLIQFKKQFLICFYHLKSLYKQLAPFMHKKNKTTEVVS